jgi:GTPase SAR1 family protein
MVGFNKQTVAFIEATDEIKKRGLAKHGQICNQIDLKRWQYDQIRIGRKVPSLEILEKLKTLYPVSVEIIERNLEKSEMDHINSDSQLLKSLKDIISAKDEIIRMKDDKIDQLEKDLESSILAHAETLKRLYSEDEIDEEIRKRQNELNMINKKKGK